MAAPRTTSHGWRIGRVAGVPVYLGRSWVLVAVVIVLIFGPVLGDLLPELADVQYVLGLLFVVLLLISVLVHEAAHSLVAQSLGYRVNRIVADFWGGHTAYENVDATPGRSALVAIAGPLANAGLAGLGYLTLQVAPAGLASVLAYAFTVANAFVAAFNLLPGLPLDGGFLVDSLVWRLTGSRATGMTVAGWCGRLLVVVLVWWAVVRPLTVSGGLSPTGLIWAGLLGAFLWMGASQAIRVGRARKAWERVTIASVLRPVVAIPATATLAQVPSLQTHRAGAVPVVIGDDGDPIGLIQSAALADLGSSSGGEAARIPVTSAMLSMPVGWVVRADPSQDVIAVVIALQTLRAPAVAITDDAGDLLGLVLAGDL